MHSAALNALTVLSGDEQKEAMESMGTEFLISVFGSDTYEDFMSRSKRGAELVAKGLKQQLLSKGWTEETCSVDVVPVKQYGVQVYKVAFFK